MHGCILIQVERGHQRCQSEVLSDFCDGSYYRSHQLFSTHANALQMMLYYDDIEVRNPLGSHTKKHKLGKWMCTASTTHTLPHAVWFVLSTIYALWVPNSPVLHLLPHILVQVSSTFCLATLIPSIVPSWKQFNSLQYANIAISKSTPCLECHTSPTCPRFEKAGKIWCVYCINFSYD